MKKLHVGSGAIDRVHPVLSAAILVAATVLGLAGCADTHWERAFYDGARNGSSQCQLKRNPTEMPCAELVNYDRYAQERAKAKSASELPAASLPTEGKQP